MPAGVRVKTPVSLVDVAPTLIAAVGGAPPPGVDGLDLAPLWRSTPGVGDERYARRMLFAEASHNIVVADQVRAVRRGRYKLVYDPITDEVQLFDLETDPRELHDVSDRHPEVVAQLLEALHAKIGATRTGPHVELDAEETERLRALGYL